jgi:hypothetical protein
MDMQLILKAELGDFLYIIIFVVLMFAGVIEKMLKAKRQQQASPPQPHDDFDDVETQPSPPPSPPPTLEEVMRRMMQTVEAPQQKEVKAVVHPMGEHSQEDIPAAGRHFYHPETIKNKEQSVRIASPVEEKIETTDFNEYYFDIRQAVISSEILNRKY